MITPNSRDIIVILDTSASMGSMGDEPTDTINEFISEQRDTDPSGVLSLWTFSTKVNKVIDDKVLTDIEKVRRIYTSGMTALYDAIGIAINAKLKSGIGLHNVVCLIITDGLENSSQVYKGIDIQLLIAKVEKDYNWKIVFMGADQNCIEEAQSIGLNQNRCMSFDMTKGGLYRQVSQLSRSISAYRSMTIDDVSVPDNQNHQNLRILVRSESDCNLSPPKFRKSERIYPPDQLVPPAF